MDAVNAQIADRLREVADLLQVQEANPFRVVAWRRAADTVAGLPESVAHILDERGIDGVTALPHIDAAIGGAIRELVARGRLALLDRLRGTLDPEEAFQRVPGIGPRTARLIHDTLHIDTLEALEAAAHDGRLATVPGMGPRKIQGVKAALQGLLQRVHGGAPAPGPPEAVPPVPLLLDIDREYRDKAEKDALPKITPRRFNPDAEAWLPVLHTMRGPFHVTALYSNTATAHAAGKTRDWVILYVTGADHHERQYTVVTETHGPLTGRRVVRGRESSSDVEP